MASNPKKPVPKPKPAPPHGNAAQIAMAYAYAQIGKPYCYAGTGPDCFDCSGLVMMAYRQAGIYLPRVAIQQVNTGTPIPQTLLEPGDLLAPDPGHIQLYVGSGKIIEAPHTGAFVRLVPVWGFWKACRITEPGNGMTPEQLNALSGNSGCASFGVSSGT